MSPEQVAFHTASALATTVGVPLEDVAVWVKSMTPYFEDEGSGRRLTSWDPDQAYLYNLEYQVIRSHSILFIELVFAII